MAKLEQIGLNIVGADDAMLRQIPIRPGSALGHSLLEVRGVLQHSQRDIGLFDSVYGHNIGAVWRIADSVIPPVA